MKHLGWALIFFVASAPAWCAKKVSVAQLEDLLHSLQQESKSDKDVAGALKQVELTEELTRAKMNALVHFLPGQRSQEQLYVLEATSANLAPPASDLPAAPAPDEAARQAMLAKAGAYVTATYEHLPGLSATRTTLRFQDNEEAVAQSSGLNGSAKDVVTSSGISATVNDLHFVNSAVAQVASVHGAEIAPAEKDKTPWGANGMIALQEPHPSLAVVYKEAQAAGGLKWLRWEMLNGRQTAVFSFEVPKKESHLAINVCCFPNISQAGSATFYSSTSAPLLAGTGAGGGGAGGVAGTFQTNTDWHNFKTITPYRGEFFILPENGFVLRMITEAELKSSDLVHQADTRVDYGQVKVGEKVFMVPIKSIVSTEIAANGDSGAGGYRTRRTLFTSEYRNYRLGGVQ